MLDYKKLLKDFQKGMFLVTGDWRHDINQKFIKGNPAAINRANLVDEESEELWTALMSEDVKAVRKEVCDVLYVVFAIAAIYDLPVEEDFMKVHINNMLKFKTGHVRADGKFVKAEDHPKVELD